MKWKSDREDEFLYLKVGIGLVVLVAIIFGAIEWNARRQAAAMMREFTRPMTDEESRQLENEFEELARMPPAAPVQTIEYRMPTKQKKRDTRPLGEGERCINGQRFRRLPNGWEEIGSC